MEAETGQVSWIQAQAQGIIATSLKDIDKRTSIHINLQL